MDLTGLCSAKVCHVPLSGFALLYTSQHMLKAMKSKLAVVIVCKTRPGFLQRSNTAWAMAVCELQCVTLSNISRDFPGVPFWGSLL